MGKMCICPPCRRIKPAGPPVAKTKPLDKSSYLLCDLCLRNERCIAAYEAAMFMADVEEDLPDVDVVTTGE